MENVQIIGIKDLDEMELEAVNRIASRGYEKIKRELKNDVSLTVHVKGHHKHGEKKRYGIHIKVLAPTKMFTSTKSVDWDLEAALHGAFEDVVKIIRHTFHTDDQNKPFTP